jgi:AcrR family transcriptional regulator
MAILENEHRPARTRANDDLEKAARRDDIIDAARILYLQDSRALPSVAQIAAQAGLAKGTVYTYFTTKEEIFIGLLADSLDTLLARLAQGLGHGQPSTDRLIDEFASYIDAHPEVPRLDAMTYQMERNLSPEAMRTHKLRTTLSLVAGGGLLERVMGLPAGRGVKILSRVYALARGLWQWLDHPPEMQAVLSGPVFAPIRPDFRSELIEALQEYMRGATMP